MGKFLLTLFATILAVLLLGKLVPYWVLMILVTVLVFFVGIGPTKAFFSAGLGFGLSWLLLAIWISIDSESDLPKKMAELMGLANDNLLWFATGLLGFVIGGFSGLTGAAFRKIFERKDSNIYRANA